MKNFILFMFLSIFALKIEAQEYKKTYPNQFADAVCDSCDHMKIGIAGIGYPQPGSGRIVLAYPTKKDSKFGLYLIEYDDDILEVIGQPNLSLHSKVNLIICFDKTGRQASNPSVPGTGSIRKFFAIYLPDKPFDISCL